MCGIAGIILSKNNTESKQYPLLDNLTQMMDTVSYRGPDGEGYAVASPEIKDQEHSKNNGKLVSSLPSEYYFGIGHKRLSILDLSSDGIQPMSFNNKGRLWITFNGEIYNYIELKEELIKEGYIFRTKTDTEVVLSAYHKWGNDCFKKFNGMWGLTIVDLDKRQIICSRDRFGIKPLFYYHDKNIFLFSSEIKQLLSLNTISVIPSRSAIYNYLVDASLNTSDCTFNQNIKELLPSRYMVISLENWRISGFQYWNLNTSLEKTNGNDIEEKYYSALKNSVQRTLRSDVELSCSLSGGLDSTSILACVNDIYRGNGKDINLFKTYSIRFEEKKYDEGLYIESVLNKIQSDYQYIYPSYDNLLENVSSYLWHQDEPVPSMSDYCRWLVYKSIHGDKIKVVISGTGGDEILGGYPWHYHNYIHDLIAGGHLSKFMKELNINNFFLKKTIKDTISFSLRRLKNHNSQYNNLFTDHLNNFDRTDHCERTIVNNNFSSRFDEGIYNYLMHKGLNAMLRFDDRGAMSQSVEARYPFLDHELVELSNSLPTNKKITGGFSKLIMRHCMKGRLPEKVLKRRDKTGLFVPEANWFKGPLKEFIFDEVLTKSSEFIKVEYLRTLFQSFLSNQTRYSPIIWRCINLIIWEHTLSKGVRPV